MSWQVIAGECVEAMRAMPEASVDSIVTDPPYGLEFMGQEWDAIGRSGVQRKAPAGGGDRRAIVDADAWAGGESSPYSRARVRWQHGVAGPRVMQEWHELWAREAFRVLRPGGYLLAFGGSRTYHRLACAVEDAGFEIRDRIDGWNGVRVECSDGSLAWYYGSGFPKSLDVSKAIDARGGNAHRAREIAAAIRGAREARGWTVGEADRRFCGGSTNWTWYEGRKGVCRAPTTEDFARIVAEWPELAPLAGLVAAAEREVVGRSDELLGRRSGIGNGVAEHYTVGGTRAEAYDVTAPATAPAQEWTGWGTALKPAHEPIVVARKPLVADVAGNVLAHGTGALNVNACRIGTEGGTARNGKATEPNAAGWANMRGHGIAALDAGRWPPNVLLDPEAAAALDEQTGKLASGVPGVMQLGVNRGAAYGAESRPPGTPMSGYGDAGGASRFFYCPKASQAERNAMDLALLPRAKSRRKRRQQDAWDGWRERARNRHPTVKPIALNRWLMRLVTRPGGRVLDPFAGSGSGGAAAVREGFEYVGIERDIGSVVVARARIAWWAMHPEAMDLVRDEGQVIEAVGRRLAAVVPGQGTLFG